MWSSREGAPEGSGKTCSDVVVMDDQAVATGMPPGPMVSTLNVTKSSKVHIGPKIVSVTQNVHNTEMIKGHFMGLELVSSKQSRRVRCSVAVFICWALIVAIGLIIYLIYIAMPKQTRLDIGLNETWYLRRGDWQARPPYGVNFLQLPLSYVIIGHSGATSCQGRFNCIETVMDMQQNHFRRSFSDIGPNFLVGGEDGWLFEGRGANVFGAMVVAYNRISISIMFIELPLPKYLWNIVKNSSRMERLSCAAALLVLITCVTLIVYFTVTSTKIDEDEDRPPHSWNITREMWLAAPYNDSLIAEHFLPLMLVIVQHTVSAECTNFAQCAAELRTMQGWFIANKKYNIPYNFMIGNEGRVYEARGWNKEGAHTFGYNRCSMGIGFVGDYREERPRHSQVSELQLNRTKMLLEDGVRRGFLRPDFLIIGAKDVHSTASPGSNLHNALRKMDNFDHKGRFRNLNCEQIQEKYGNVTFN